MNQQIREIVKQAGGEFWQRIESNGELNQEAYITFDPPGALEKFAELIVRECVQICNDTNDASYLNGVIAGRKIKQHFGVEE